MKRRRIALDFCFLELLPAGHHSRGSVAIKPVTLHASGQTRRSAARRDECAEMSFSQQKADSSQHRIHVPSTVAAQIDNPARGMILFKICSDGVEGICVDLRIVLLIPWIAGSSRTLGNNYVSDRHLADINHVPRWRRTVAKNRACHARGPILVGRENGPHAVIRALSIALREILWEPQETVPFLELGEGVENGWICVCC